MTFKTVEKSPTLLLNERSNELQRAGHTIYKFGFGQSPFSPPKRVQQALSEAVHHKEYAPVQGLATLRERIASFHTQLDGYPIDEQQILIASGSKILLFNLLMALEQAVVLIPAPGWVSYASQARLAGHKLHFIPTSHQNRWRIDPVDLDQILSHQAYSSLSKILIINYPGNPDGLAYTADEFDALTRVLRKHQAWVMADEIYGLLHHTGQHLSLAKHYPEQTIVTSGLSKWCGAGGWRFGIQILPKTIPSAFREALLAIASATYSCAPTPVQIAACQAYVLDDTTRHYLAGQRQILSAIGQDVYSMLVDNGIAVHPPEGGFYLLLDFTPFRDLLAARGITTDMQLCTQLLDDTGVALLPGSAFNNHPDQLTARLAYVDFDGTSLLEAVTDQPDQLHSQAVVSSTYSHMVEGVHKLIGWLINSGKH